MDSSSSSSSNDHDGDRRYHLPEYQDSKIGHATKATTPDARTKKTKRLVGSNQTNASKKKIRKRNQRTTSANLPPVQARIPVSPSLSSATVATASDPPNMIDDDKCDYQLHNFDFEYAIQLSQPEESICSLQNIDYDEDDECDPPLPLNGNDYCQYFMTDIKPPTLSLPNDKGKGNGKSSSTTNIASWVIELVFLAAYSSLAITTTAAAKG